MVGCCGEMSGREEYRATLRILRTEVPVMEMGGTKIKSELWAG